MTTEFVIKNEPLIRIGFFIGIFLVIALVELIVPRREMTTSKKSRWFGNIGIVLINTFLARILFPAGAVGTAIWVEHSGWGILNLNQFPFWLKVVTTVIVLDFAVYIQHVMFHAVPVFWRLHMVHHADMDYDVTTGTRFHPIEIILSFGIKASVIALLGAPAAGVIIFEILLNGTSMFNHGNFFVPLGFDRVLRLFLVTPDMHRVHHSVFPNETNKNFGFSFPWWDRWLGTYRPQPTKGHEQMTIGLNQFRDPSRLTLKWMLAMPFIGKTGNYAIGARGTRSTEKPST